MISLAVPQWARYVKHVNNAFLEHACTVAAAGGNPEMLTRLQNVGSPWDVMKCAVWPLETAAWTC